MDGSSKSIENELLMAFAPSDPTIAHLILFLCIISWGSYAPLRRTSPTTNGSVFGTLAFFAEFTWALFASFTFGSIGSSPLTNNATNATISTHSIIFDTENNFFRRLVTDISINPNAALLIILGGALVGFGDSVSFTVLSYVPSSLAFPLVAGTCTAVGTVLSYAVDGSDKPYLLFAGVVLLLPSIVLLSYAQSMPSKEEKEGETKEIEVAIKIMDTQTQKESTKTPTNSLSINSSSTTTTNNTTTNTTATWKWVVLLIGVGIINSTWGPLSTVGRRDCSVHSAYFLLSMGRIGVQPISQSLTQIFVFQKTPCNLLRECYNVPRRDKLCAYGCGLLIGIGYYSYFVGSNVVNKSAAFAISNCSPLWTIVIGVFVCKDLIRYKTEAKFAVVGSAVCYIVAVLLLTLSGT